MRGSRGGQGGQTPPEKSQNIGFLSITGKSSRSPEKSQSYQASIQCWAIMGMPVKRHFSWWANVGPLIVVFGSYLPSSTHPPLTKLSGFAHECLPVFACLSLPAKSTRFNFPARICSSPSSSADIISRLIVKIEWLLDESAFMSVAPVARFFQPFCMIFSHSTTLCTGC